MRRLIILILFSLFMLSSCRGHEHSYSLEWMTDNEVHYKMCIGEECGHTIASAKHSFYGVNGTSLFKCSVCGFEKADTGNNVSHTHILSPEYTSNASYHWQICTECNEASPIENHLWTNISVVAPSTSEKEGKAERICSVCGKYSLIILERLPEKMDESEWIVAFEFDNLRIRECVKSGSITLSDSVYSVFGELVAHDSGGVITYKSHSAISQLDFSESYALFSHYGDQVYKSDEIYTNVDGTNIKLTNVTVTFGDGHISSITYSMSLGGLFGTFTYGYSLYDWGEVELSPKRLTRDEINRFLSEDNFECDFHLSYSKLTSSLTASESNLTVIDGEYTCKYYTDGRLIKTKRGERTFISSEIVCALRSVMNFDYIDPQDFVYEEGVGDYVYVGSAVDVPEIGKITSIIIIIIDERITSVYAELENGDTYSYEFTYY